MTRVSLESNLTRFRFFVFNFICCLKYFLLYVIIILSFYSPTEVQLDSFVLYFFSRMVPRMGINLVPETLWDLWKWSPKSENTMIAIKCEIFKMFKVHIDPHQISEIEKKNKINKKYRIAFGRLGLIFRWHFIYIAWCIIFHQKFNAILIDSNSIVLN